MPHSDQNIVVFKVVHLSCATACETTIHQLRYKNSLFVYTIFNERSFNLLYFQITRNLSRIVLLCGLVNTSPNSKFSNVIPFKIESAYEAKCSASVMLTFLELTPQNIPCLIIFQCFLW